MILNYWKPKRLCGEGIGNFGDELNVWLWKTELGRSFFDEDERVVFYGIGTLIRKSMKQDELKIIFGTGAVGDDVAKADSTWRVYFVRGPLTARAINVDKKKAITDPAILICNHFSEAEIKSRKYGFMPHIHQAALWAEMYKEVCEDVGLLYIDPRDGPENIIKSIASVEVMVCEAMHAAIAADALRIPWIPVYSRVRPSTFKWTDWCMSLQLDYAPKSIINFDHPAKKIGFSSKASEGVAKLILKNRIKNVINKSHQCLSNTKVHNEKVKLVMEQINIISNDIRSQGR